MNDAETVSETIEMNSMVNDIKGSTTVVQPREGKNGKTIFSCMVDKIKKVNIRGLSRMTFAIS